MKDKKKVLIIASVLLLVVITLGVTYALFSYVRSGTTENTITSDSITFLYEEIDKQGSGISINDAIPVEDSVGKQGQAFNFRIISTASNSISIPYEINVRKKDGSDNLDSIVKLYLTKVDNSNNETEVELAKYSELQTVTKNNHQEKLLHIDKVPANSNGYTQKYRLRMWIDNGTDFSDGTYNNKEFSVMVNVYSSGHVETEQDRQAASRTDITSFSVENTALTETTTDHYEMEVSNGETEVTIDVTPTNPYTTVTVEKTDSTYTNVIAANTGIQRLSTSKKFSINPGNNYFRITLKSEDGNTTSYKYLMIKNSTEIIKTGDSILSILDDNTLTTGYYSFRVNNKIYPVDLIVLEGNQTITQNTDYGELEDCASGTTSDKMATKMVVVKVNGDYTVNSSVTVGPKYHTEYGGPKGFLLYVTGTLTNSGTIQNNHGAYAYGDDVYLYKNANDTYEYIPGTGGAGGTITGKDVNGKAGSNGSTVNQTGNKRALAGGGSGSRWETNCTSGSGGSATSYSGGSGGGGGYANGSTGENGSNYGGAGGGTPLFNNRYGNKSGGAGNPGGGVTDTSFTTNKGKNGTGGLLIIYANTYNNTNSNIKANGNNTNFVTNTYGVGGSSGGGSINIFANTITNSTSYTNINVDGGVGTTNTNISSGWAGKTGGAGGTGTINVGTISTGSYVSTYKNY